MKRCFAFIFIFVSLNCFAATHGFDPTILAKKQPSAYTHYLESLFRAAAVLPVSQVTAEPKLKKGTSSHAFRTEIRTQSRVKRANFAGKWVLVVVGQGMGAFRYFLVHAKTGKVIDPQLMTTNGPPLFLADRSLLVIAGSVGEETLDDAFRGVYGGPKAFRWNQERFEPVALGRP